jgi:hypothetical protein
MSINVSTSQSSALIRRIPARAGGARTLPGARHRRKRMEAVWPRHFRAMGGLERLPSPSLKIVIPAEAGIHRSGFETAEKWVPAFAGTTIWELPGTNLTSGR